MSTKSKTKSKTNPNDELEHDRFREIAMELKKENKLNSKQVIEAYNALREKMSAVWWPNPNKRTSTYNKISKDKSAAGKRQRNFMFQILGLLVGLSKNKKATS